MLLLTKEKKKEKKKKKNRQDAFHNYFYGFSFCSSFILAVDYKFDIYIYIGYEYKFFC